MEMNRDSVTTNKISVIVPIYNAEKYIEECVHSVLSQTYKNLELILVDDGSVDNSGTICDKMSETDDRIKVIHQENQGVTKARFNGFLSSVGDYIYFMDADDTLREESLEYMLSLFRVDIDIVVSDYRCDTTLSWLDFAKCLFKQDFWNVYSKLYRRSCFDKYVFDTPRYFKCGEDFLMQLRILKNLKGNILCNTSQLYNYRKVDSSVSHTFVPTMEYEIRLLSQVDSIIKLLPNEEEISYAHFRFRISYLGGMMGLQYPLCFQDKWIRDILSDSKKYNLTLREKITIKAVDISPLRLILIAEKKLRHFYRVYVKRV